MSKPAFAIPARPGLAQHPLQEQSMQGKPREDEVERDLADLAERARALARRFRQDPLLGDREARLADIRRRWYGWEDHSSRRPD